MILRVFFMVLGVVAGTLVGCSPKKPVLHVYAGTDSIDPDLVSAFEKEYRCHLKVDTYKLSSNETYDLIFLDSRYVGQMQQHGSFLEFDKAKLPNVTAQFDESYLRLTLNPNMTHSVPYAITFTGVAYRMDTVTPVPASWAVFDNPAYKGKSSLLDNSRETIGAALKLLGFSLNTTNLNELAKARDVVLRWKKNIANFEDAPYTTNLSSAGVSLAQRHNGAAVQRMSEAPGQIGFAFPDEGFPATCNEMVILSTTREPALAHAFINFMYAPENAAKNIQYICTVMPNKGAVAQLPEAFRKNPVVIPPPAILSKAEAIRDLDENNVLYANVWDAIKDSE